MQANQSREANGLLLFVLIVINILTLRWAFINSSEWYALLAIILPLLLLSALLFTINREKAPRNNATKTHKRHKISARELVRGEL
ncbi:MAG: hypothetical protein P0Y53_12965 [Candidatus Pseudobacter hemicellulosilyticus]|uniref:Uncharacterized protein n=1 Tax=Candidatus Pseudobacter hemicellulosilyticus TaxID=3121375 RepID=A0AAJ5WX64_9BACT|nr:MAG: hypothetical protein P0Y53_12965 [Pseudobacter sp.]